MHGAAVNIVDGAILVHCGRELDGVEKIALQGLIQIAAGLHHLGDRIAQRGSDSNDQEG